MVNRRSPPRAPLRIRPSNALFRGVTPRRLFPVRPATPRAPVRRNAERAAAVRIARMINGLPLGVRRRINYGLPMSVTPYAASRMPRSFRR